MKKKRSTTGFSRQVVASAKRVLMLEARAVEKLKRHINGNFVKAVGLILDCRGRVVVTGMGKPGLIGRKISATLASTGTPSLFMHPTEAMHGDFGVVGRGDVILAISNSGETEEIVRLIPMIRRIGATLIALTGNKNSLLAKKSDYVLDVSVDAEACPMGLAPTTSTTAALAMGDALAVALTEQRRFKKEDFAVLHPGGTIGKQLLLQVKDIMRTGKDNPILVSQTKIKDVLIAITESHAGAANIVNGHNKLVGIFTDGDLRRAFRKDEFLLDEPVSKLMTKRPKTIRAHALAAEALRIMKDLQIDELPAVDDKGRCVGILDIQDLLKAGVF